MIKGGLFLCSIGLIIVLFSANQNTAQYNIFNLTTGVFLVVVGAILYFKGVKKAKKSADHDQEVK